MAGVGEAWIKMSADNEKLKKHWLKRPRPVPENEIWTKI